MNERRRTLVGLAFKKLDVDKSGFVTVDDLMINYDPAFHP
jgi:hypothetical protein